MRTVAILAGGLGTRLGGVTAQIPKLLVELDGRPFAEYQLDWLRDEGVTHVVYCLGHLGEQVVEALGTGDRWGMRFDFVMDGPTLLGTGGALRRAMPSRAEEFFVLYGDSLLTCDLAAVERTYEAGGRSTLMTVVRNDNQWDRSNVVFADGRSWPTTSPDPGRTCTTSTMASGSCRRASSSPIRPTRRSTSLRSIRINWRPAS